jgi:hypothetical protein
MFPVSTVIVSHQMAKDGPKSLRTMLQSLEQRAKDRGAAGDGHTPVLPGAARRRVSTRAPASTGTPGPAVIAAANAKLERFVRQRGIEQFELFPSSEFPTPFTRLPLFPPVQRTTARRAATGDWIALHSRWDSGGVFKAGPGLTIYDEDTLIGLMTLRSQGLAGPADQLPIPAQPGALSSGLAPGNPVRVHALYCLISQVESTIQGRTPHGGWGGRAIHKRRDSLNRLAAITLRFEQPKGADGFQGKAIHLLYIEYVSTEADSCYYVQFHPLVSQWLETYRTFIDFDLRRKLTPLGKAMHRFLASQRSNRTYTVDLAILFQAIGANGELRDLKRSALVQLAKMQDEKFLEKFEIAGTGRSTPWRLTAEFARG